MLDEVALRRPGFRPDVPVVLADGQTWHLPKPRVKFGRRIKSDGKRGVAARTEFGADYDALLYRMFDADGSGLVLAQLDLGAALLKSNYDLTDDQVDEILCLDYSEDASPADAATRDAILNTAQGIAPKAWGSGDDRD